MDKDARIAMKIAAINEANKAESILKPSEQAVVDAARKMHYTSQDIHNAIQAEEKAQHARDQDHSVAAFPDDIQQLFKEVVHIVHGFLDTDANGLRLTPDCMKWLAHVVDCKLEKCLPRLTYNELRGLRRRIQSIQAYFVSSEAASKPLIHHVELGELCKICNRCQTINAISDQKCRHCTSLDLLIYERRYISNNPPMTNFYVQAKASEEWADKLVKAARLKAEMTDLSYEKALDEILQEDWMEQNMQPVGLKERVEPHTFIIITAKRGRWWDKFRNKPTRKPEFIFTKDYERD